MIIIIIIIIIIFNFFIFIFNLYLSVYLYLYFEFKGLTGPKKIKNLNITILIISFVLVCFFSFFPCLFPLSYHFCHFKIFSSFFLEWPTTPTREGSANPNPRRQGQPQPREGRAPKKGCWVGCSGVGWVAGSVVWCCVGCWVRSSSSVNCGCPPPPPPPSVVVRLRPPPSGEVMGRVLGCWVLGVGSGVAWLGGSVLCGGELGVGLSGWVAGSGWVVSVVV